MKSKPILFIDFDGTICFDKYWRSLPDHQFKAVQDFLFGEDKSKVNDWMKGKYSAEEINKLVAEKLDIPYEELWDSFVAECKTMSVSKEVLNKISSLRSKYTVILVTGNMDSFSRFTVPALGLNRYFDHINNSFFAGKLKDESGGFAFTDYSKSFGVSMSDCILIDNSVKACEAFRNLGGTAHQIEAGFDIEYFLRELI